MKANVSLTLDVPDAPPQLVFERVVDELALRLQRSESPAMRLDAGPAGGLVELRGDREVPVAEVHEWRAGEEIVLSWRASDWDGAQAIDVRLRFASAGGGTRVTVEHGAWVPSIAGRRDGSAAAGERGGGLGVRLLGPLVLATSPSGIAEWITDRRARRPTGPDAVAAYREPREHQAGFQVTLDALELGPADRLLEVGCGGGAFVRQALHSGCRATAVDHSAEMVRLASAQNAEAVAEGRLEVLRASAERLPFADGSFTCAAMTHVFFFLEDPQAALRECRRVLASGGRAAIFTAGPELAGTPAAPEPICRWMRLYTAPELERLGREAGFSGVRVDAHGGAYLLFARA